MHISLRDRLETLVDEPLLAMLDRAVDAARRDRLDLYAVGGVVRDALLERPTADLDLVVVGDPLPMIEALRRELDIEPVPSPFGTWTFDAGERGRLDVAQARREHYPAPGTLPRVEAATNLEEDLGRRDFTINAMAVALTPSVVDRSPSASSAARPVVDPCDGLGDLERGLIRVLHPRSFEDDPTRLFRAVEFAVRLDFEIEAGTADLARQALAGGALETLSPQRSLAAWERMVRREPVGSLALAADIGLLRALHPDAVEGLSRAESGGIEAGDSPAVVLRLLGSSDASVARALARRFGPSPEEGARWASFPARLRAVEAWAESRAVLAASDVRAAVGGFDETELVLVDRIGSEAARDVVERYRTEVAPVTLAIRGGDLVAAGFPPGPAIGRALEATLEARLDGEVGPEGEFEYACARLRADE